MAFTDTVLLILLLLSFFAILQVKKFQYEDIKGQIENLGNQA
jgi:hypothetical protein